MAEIEIFTIGKTLEDAKENIVYYVREHFLRKEYEEKNRNVYNKYILPKYECDVGLRLTFPGSSVSNDFIDDILLPDIDESKIPIDMYKANYDLYIAEKYNSQISKVLTKIDELSISKPSIYRSILFDFLLDDKFEELPEEVYLIVCSFPRIQSALMRMSETNYQVFVRTVNKMMELYSFDDVITNFFLIITNCDADKQFSEEDVNNIDYDVFANIMFNDWDLNDNLGVPKKGVNIFDCLKEQTKDKITSDNLEEIIDAVLILKYALTLNDIKKLFTNSLELLVNDNSDCALLYKEVLDILRMSKEKLIALYNSVSETSLKNYYLCKKYLRNKNLQMYNQTLTKVDGSANEFELEDDFHMIIHVTGAFSINNYENYKESWNREQTTSYWMSCSYISNELICTAPFNEKSVCFGFNSMEDDSLLYYSTEDLESETNSIEQRWAISDPRYIFPEYMINNTGRQCDGKNYYNEMNFVRKQQGKRKNPDYIIMFRNNNEFLNEEKSRKAQADFGNIPIVIVDIDKMLKKSEDKVKLLYEKFVETQNEEIASQIYTTVINCRKTCYNWKKVNNFFLSEECHEIIDKCYYSVIYYKSSRG